MTKIASQRELISTLEEEDKGDDKDRGDDRRPLWITALMVKYAIAAMIDTVNINSGTPSCHHIGTEHGVPANVIEPASVRAAVLVHLVQRGCQPLSARRGD